MEASLNRKDLLSFEANSFIWKPAMKLEINAIWQDLSPPNVVQLTSAAWSTCLEASGKINTMNKLHCSGICLSDKIQSIDTLNIEQ